ncbi:trichohyalin-like [Condylostylus longicornis]|uniref:trichohyalin-like n=1 Tax=Condylostylus longicornis TaxID=2530218 RepID=UPI00244D9AF9|nr:trichohyalin-like [Condylostylus longicornis]
MGFGRWTERMEQMMEKQNSALCNFSEARIAELVKRILQEEQSQSQQSKVPSANRANVMNIENMGAGSVTKFEADFREFQEESMQQAGFFTSVLEELLDQVQELKEMSRVKDIKVDELAKKQQGVKFMVNQKDDESVDSSDSESVETLSEAESESESEAEENKPERKENRNEGTRKEQRKGNRRAEVVPVLVAEPSIKKKKKSRKQKTPIPSEKQESLQQTQTLEDLQQQLKEMKEELKRQREEKKKLTEEEKSLLTAELERKWGEERYERRFGPRENRRLTEEEQRMTRPELQRQFAQTRRNVWADRQRAMGIPTYQCDNCGRFEREGQPHSCLRSAYSGPLQRRGGVPYHRQMVVEGTSTGVNIRQQPIVDIERLKKEHAAMTKTIEDLVQQQQQLRRGGEQDEEMEDPQNQQSQPSSSVASISGTPQLSRNFQQ